MIPIPLIYAAVAGAAIAAAAAWQVQDWRFDAKEKQRIEQEAKDLHRMTERAGRASAAFETKRAANEVRYRTVTVTLEKIVERPVYLNQCIDDDGLRVLNEQIARAADPGEPRLKLPKP